MSLISLLVTVLVLGLVFWLVYWIIGQIPMPQPFRVVALAIIGLIAVLLLLSLLFGGVTLPVFSLR